MDKKYQNLSTEQLISTIQKLNSDLSKSELIYKSANLAALPDKGERLKKSINTLKWDISVIEHMLNRKLEKSSSEENSIKNGLYRTTPEMNLKNEPIDRREISIDEDIIFLDKPTESADVDNFGKQAQKTFQQEQTLTLDRLKTLHGSLMSQPTENDLADDPHGLKIELMHHQKYGLSWLLWREKQNPPGGILADDMGLGKTLTMISLIVSTKDNYDADSDSDDDMSEFVKKIKHLKYKGGTLVVCPASVVYGWDKEIQNRCKKRLLEVFVFHGNNRQVMKPRRLAGQDVVITTYDTLVSEMKKETSALYQIRWRRIILDEAHIIRNNKSLKCEAVCKIVAIKKWAITGTPIQNKESDLYSLMKFLRCSPFDDIRVWKRWVDNKNEAGLKRLSTVLQSIMLRRTKQELQAQGKIDSLPEKFIETVEVTLNKDERAVYEKVLLYSRTLFAQFLHQQAEKRHMSDIHAGNFNQFPLKETQFNKAQQKLLQMHGTDVKSHEILVFLLRLRQICCHPTLIKVMLDREDIETTDGIGSSDPIDTDDKDMDLLSKLGNIKLDDEEEDLNESIGVDKAVVQDLLTSENPIFNEKKPSSKVNTALKIIQDVINKDEKIVVISQWSTYLEILGSYFDKMAGCTYEMFTGKMNVKRRQVVTEEFNKKGSNPKILLLSLTAGGVGLNLTGANNLLILDVHWNPQLELQAHDRIYRFGQDKQVFVYRLLCKDTIEERIENLQNKKLELAGNVLHGKNGRSDSKLTMDDLKMLFGL